MRVLLPILFLAATLGLGLWDWHTRRDRQRRLHRLMETGTTPSASASLSVPALSRASRALPSTVVRNLHVLGIEPDFRRVAIAVAAWGLPVAAAGFLLGPLAALLLAVTLILLSLAFLNIMTARRINELGALMPGFLDRVRQLLTVGNSLPTAFARAVQGGQPRLIAFFAPTLRRMGNGASFSESIRQCAEDIDLYEMRLFAAAVATNIRFGGSLNSSLSNLVSYLRKRASIERELRANTAQIRAGAWVLGLLPMGVGALIVVQNPDYARWFISNPTGKKLLLYCLSSQIIGALLMRNIVRTKF